LVRRETRPKSENRENDFYSQEAAAAAAAFEAAAAEAEAAAAPPLLLLLPGRKQRKAGRREGEMGGFSFRFEPKATRFSFALEKRKTALTSTVTTYIESRKEEEEKRSARERKRDTSDASSQARASPSLLPKKDFSSSSRGPNQTFSSREGIHRFLPLRKRVPWR